MYLELSEKSNVVFKQQPDVIDAIAEHGDPFHPDPEGKTRVLLRIVTHMSKNFRMDHPAAQDFHPPGVRTDPAAFSAAHNAPHVHFSAWFREREEAWPEPYRYFTAEELVDKLYKHSFEIAERDTFINHEPFHLMNMGE